MPHPVVCGSCGREFLVPAHRLKTARACSHQCLGALQSKERRGKFGVGPRNPMWKDGRAPNSYRRHLKKACERCGTTTHLLIHHRDDDRTNNKSANLETLCKACHQSHHTKRDPKTGRYVSA